MKLYVDVHVIIVIAYAGLVLILKDKAKLQSRPKN